MTDGRGQKPKYKFRIPHFEFKSIPIISHDRPRHTIVKQRGLDWNLWLLCVKII
jgi:hypothetical protein